MEKQKKQDLMTRKEASAPNLTPVQYFEGPDFVCCSEIFKKPKSKVCEGIPSAPNPKTHCMRKGRRVFKICEWPKEYNERDILFRPIRWRCTTPKKKHKKAPAEPSLGSPIGLSKSSFGMKFLEGKQSEQVLLGFATNLIAFAEYYITPEIEWDEKVLNRILLEGQRLYVDSRASLPATEKPKEINIKRTFKLCDNTFDILLNDAFMVGQVIGQEAAIPNLHWGLLKFFKKFQFCLLQIENWYVLLWKNADVYFVFDCYGRRPLDLMTDRHHGVAVLVCLRHIENVSHLIMNMSSVHSEDFFIIRNVQVKSLTPCGGKPAEPIVDREVEFETVTPDYAILRATIHLGSSCFKEIRFRHAIPVAFCALINAKIDPTPTWNRAVLDKIIKLGADFYKQWTKCDISVDLGITDVPSSFIFGQFVVEIDVVALAENGLWKCTPSYQMSELTQALGRAFSKNANIIVQIQNRTYALWRKGEFYYILDPYSHQCSLEKKKIVTASLRMCVSFDKMCCIFTQVLLELFEESNFIIHLVKMLKIYEWDSNRGKSTEIPCICLAAPNNEDGQEVASINESVIGNYGYVCKNEEEIEDSDSADLDSPGLSQTRLEDYTDLRRDFIDESEEETEEEEDDEEILDLESEEGEDDDESDETGGGDGKVKKSKGETGGEGKDKKGKKGKSDRGKKNKKDNGSDITDDTDGKGKKKKKGGKGGGDADDDGGGKKGKKGKKGRKGGDDDDDDDDSDAPTGRKGKKSGKGGKGGNGDGDDDDSDGKGKKKKSSGGGKDGKGKKRKSKSKNGSDDDDDDDGDGKGKKRKSKNKKGDDDGDGGGKDKKGKKRKSKNKKGGSDDDDDGDGKGKRKKSKSKNQSEDDEVEGRKGRVSIDDKSKKSSNQGDSGEEGIEDGHKSKSGSSGRGSRSGKDSRDVPSETSRRQKHQRRKQQDGDDTSSNEFRIPGAKPNSYPGYTEEPQNLAVVGSESGNYESLCNLLRSGFRCADRILTMTPWGDYVAFKHEMLFFVFDGCTCNLRAIRHMDLSVGTAGLLCFTDLHSLIKYIENGKGVKKPTTYSKRTVVDQICDKYCC